MTLPSRQDAKFQRLIGAESGLDVHLLPIRIFDVVDADDLVPDLNACFFRGRIGIDPSHNRGFIDHGGVLVMDHVHAREQRYGEQDVHGWPGQGNEEALPAGMGQKLSRIAGAVVHGIFARHFDVAAERNGADAVVGFALW